MTLRFQVTNGIIEPAQSFDSPAIYLDHWAIRELSSDPYLGARFVTALKNAGGCLVLSYVNIVELAGPDDLRHAEDAANFLESVLPNTYFAMFDLSKSIKQEMRQGQAHIRLPAPPDLGLLAEVARQRPDDSRLFTIAGLIRIVAQNRDLLLSKWKHSNMELAKHVNSVRANAKTVKEARSFKCHNPSLPTYSILQELLRPLFLDPAQRFDDSDAGDVHHAITSLAHCDYVLLDRRWEAFRNRMVDHFVKLRLSIHVAEVFSKQRDGVARFIARLENPENAS